MIAKDAACNKISELVECFVDQFAFYKKEDYNEMLARYDFIDPFFKALGCVGTWTMSKITLSHSEK